MRGKISNIGLCLLLLFAATLSLLRAHQSSVNNDAELSAIFDQLFSDAMLQQFATSSITVAVVKDDKIIYQNGYGFSNPETQTRADPEKTLYYIGSVTKTFTTTAALQLAEKGILSINDADVNTYLPTRSSGKPFISSSIIGSHPSGDSYMNLPQFTTSDQIHLFNLMTHSSGFDEKYVGMSAASADTVQTLESYLMDNMPPRVRKPNMLSTYSNHALGLLGLIVERNNPEKLSFADYLKKNIFTPLGMTNTYYGAAEVEGNANLAVPYLYTDAKRTNYAKLDNFGQYLNLQPAGAIVSTVTELAKYAISHLNHGAIPNSADRILEEATANAMYQEQFTMKSGLNGFGLSWFQGEAQNVHFVEHGGALPPHFASFTLFHNNSKSALIMLSVGAPTSVSLMNVARRKLISSWSVMNSTSKAFDCSDSMTLKGFDAPFEGAKATVNPVTGICMLQVPKTSIKLKSTDYETRFADYEGCYINSRYEHTTWTKLISVMNVPYCFYRSGAFLQTYYHNLVLIETDQSPNMFVLAQSANEGKDLLMDASLNQRASFMVVPSSGVSRASFLLIDQIPMEYSTLFFLAFTLQFFITAFALVQACGLGCCLIGFSVSDIRNLFRKYWSRKEDYASEEYSRDLDEEETGAGLSSSREKHHYARRRLPKVLTAAIVVTVLTVVLFFLINIVDIISFVAVNVELVVINPSKLLPQSDTLMKFLFTLPILNTILIGFFIILSVIMFILRCIRRRDLGISGVVCTLLFPCSTLPIIALHVLYFMILSYYNLYGPMFV